MNRLTTGLLLVAAVFLVNCSSAKKKEPVLSDYRGKKIALVELEGTPTAKKIVEVALVNQLMKRGTFILVSKEDVSAARAHFSQDPRKWKEIATRAGGDFALRVNVKKFIAETKSGYSKDIIEDSQMKEDTGKAEYERTYKVKALNAKVAMDLAFTNLSTGETRNALAKKESQEVGDDRNGAIHLTPRLVYLEKLTNQAFAEFFSRYE